MQILINARESLGCWILGVSPIVKHNLVWNQELFRLVVTGIRRFMKQLNSILNIVLGVIWSTSAQRFTMEALIFVGADILGKWNVCAISVFQDTHVEHGVQIVWIDSQGLIVHVVRFQEAAIRVIKVDVEVEEWVFLAIPFALLAWSGDLSPRSLALQTSELGKGWRSTVSVRFQVASFDKGRCWFNASVVYVKTDSLLENKPKTVDGFDIFAVGGFKIEVDRSLGVW